MKLSEDRLIERLNIWVPKLPGFGRNRLPAPPVTEAEMLEAEAELGFTLPHLLRRLYLEVSDGGLFFLPLGKEQRLADEDHFPNTLIVWGLARPSATQEEVGIAWCNADREERLTLWPERVLVIQDCGCNIYRCLDFSKPECPVFIDNEGILTLEAPSLHEWLEARLDRRLGAN